MKEATLTTSYRYVDHEAQHAGQSHDLRQPGGNPSGRDADIADAGLRRYRATVICA